MLRAWLLTLDILIRIGLLKLPQQEQSEELDRDEKKPEQSEELERNKEQQHRNCNYDTVD